MSNPYRARPGRSRIDSSVSSSFNVHNQNSWNLSQPRSAPLPDQNAYPQNMTFAQPKQQANDSWDWGVDPLNNGNDSWDWNVDQQTESQLPQSPPSQQLHPQPPPQPPPQSTQYQPYLTQNQPPSAYPQDNYYKNVNGNNRFIPATPSTVSNNSEPYHQFSNFNYDQHQQFPPRPPSANLQKETPVSPKPQEAMVGQNHNWNSMEQPPQNWQDHWQDQNTNKQLWVKQPQQVNESAKVDYSRQWSEHQDAFSRQQQDFTQSWHQPESQWNQEATFAPTAAINTETMDDQKKSDLTPVTSSMSMNEPAKFLKDRQDSTVSESSKASSNSKSQDNLEVDWNADIEWDTVATSEVAANFSQMNLNNDPGKIEGKSKEMAPFKVESTEVPENVPVLEQNDSRNFAQKEAVGAPSGSNVESSNYDRWYNHWTTQDTKSNSEWPVEPNVENYENIQQPSEFANLEVVTLESQKRNLFGSRDSINKETLDNDPKLNVAKEVADFRQEQSNVEVVQQNVQADQTPENYEFASNDRNTFLETGELTDSHQGHEPTPPSQDDENDEVPNDIPFLREVPGQSSTIDRRNDPTGQEQYVQTGSRIGRNDPSGQEQQVQRTLTTDRIERRDVPPGQERNVPVQRTETESLERRNILSGRERPHLPQQSRNNPSGEERPVVQVQSMLEPSETREVPGRGNEIDDNGLTPDSGVRQILGRSSPSNSTLVPDDRSNARVVTGSQEVLSSIPVNVLQESPADLMNKREEAVGASIRENKDIQGPAARRDSYEDGDDEGSINSRDGSRERRRDLSPDRRRYDFDRKSYYDRDREFEDDYYYDRRRGDFDRSFNSREDLDRRDNLYRDDDRRHQSRDDLDRHSREDDRRDRRIKEDIDDRDGRRRMDDRRRDRPDDLRRRDRERDVREYDTRYQRDREYVDRDRRRDDRRHRRYDDYDSRDSYRRDYYDDYGRSSRPSSRSSYNDRDRDYYMRSRDPYFYNGYNYEYSGNYNSNYYTYTYLENLRRTNPAAYAEWYHKYYSNHSQTNARAASNYAEDRASVHSGQSSCDDRLLPKLRTSSPKILQHPPNKSLYAPCFCHRAWIRTSSRRTTVRFEVDRSTSDKRNLTDISVLADQTVASSRLNLMKFSSAHIKGSFSVGSLLYVYPSYPAEGERARIDILRVDNVLQHDALTRELKTYPGPLIKQVGVTHKKTIIEYCEAKIKKAATNEDLVDQASYILLYKFMIMLIQQNGNVVGVDIATLLLKNKEAYPYDASKEQRYASRRESMISQRSTASVGEASVPEFSSVQEKVDVKSLKTIDEITDKFRETLLYGLVQEALEYAMDEGLWGHALFLASKLDKRTHASVMTRFANSLPTQDPLQTLYQLHSGRVPASVTCIADRKWDDWRPHLAMIISNTSANPEVNRRSIMMLGDTLAQRGDIHAAHFCYILAQVDFASYEAKDAKLVLIGANHHKPYDEFATSEAIMLTEIYEYARNLSEPGFTLIDLQTFKFKMAVKMADHGMLEKALLYIEQVAVNIAKEPAKYSRVFIGDVYQLGDRIKYHDPVCKDSLEDAINLTWLNNLAEVVNKYQAGEIIQENYTLTNSVSRSYTGQPEYQEGPSSMMEITSSVDSTNNWQPNSLPGVVTEQYDQSSHYTSNVVEHNHYKQQDYWQGQQSYVAQEQTYPQPEWQQQQLQNSQQYGSQSESDGNQQQQQQQPQNWDYESEREEKPSTPEVSSPSLEHTCCKPGDYNAQNAVRRRKPLSDSPGPLLQCASLANPSEKTSPKFSKYPRVTSSYPPLVVTPIKPRRLSPRLTRPPSSQPPVFLKCKPKKLEKTEESPKTTDNDTNAVNDASATNKADDTSATQRTDLDIQLRRLKLEGLGVSSSSSDSERHLSSASDSGTAQTLTQYLNFEDKKVVKVAPHIRRKDVICDTVDAWSRDSDSAEAPRYKPLVFGGTYPIDLPLEGATK